MFDNGTMGMEPFVALTRHDVRVLAKVCVDEDASRDSKFILIR